MGKTLHLRIEGRVQGVGYREWLAEQARGNAVTGWARNRRDGTVEAVVSGSAEALNDLIARAKEGPRSAQVKAIETSDAADGGWPDFHIRPTE